MLRTCIVKVSVLGYYPLYTNNKIDKLNNELVENKLL